MREGAPDSSERVRLFVALELPARTRETLARWAADGLGSRSSVRLTPAEDLHVTLCFLGWRPASEVRAIARACSGVAAVGALELVVGGALWLPPRRPRVLAVALDDPSGALAALQRRLSEALAAGEWYEAERRPFLAHATVARLGAGGSPHDLRPPPPDRLRGRRLTLYRSRLDSTGARYERLSCLQLAEERR